MLLNEIVFLCIFSWFWEIKIISVLLCSWFKQVPMNCSVINCIVMHFHITPVPFFSQYCISCIHWCRTVFGFCRIMWPYFTNKVTYERAKISDRSIFKAGTWSYESKKAELYKSDVHKSIAWEVSRHYWSISHFYTTFVFVLFFCSITYLLMKWQISFTFLSENYRPPLDCGWTRSI